MNSAADTAPASPHSAVLASCHPTPHPGSAAVTDPATLTGRVHSVETLGGADGPGLRAVVFLQGCPLRCRYCHNPDSWDPAGGEERTAAEVIAEVVRCKAYFGERGGVTLSGGEPLLQPAFAAAVLAGCRAAGIHTALDTSGCFCNDEVNRVLAATDLALVDLKDPDPDRCRDLTSGELHTTLRFLDEAAAREVEVWIRHVIVPGWNDTTAHLERLAAALADRPAVTRVDLLGYHTLGLEKWQALGRPYPLAGTPALAADRLAELETELLTLGLPVHPSA